MSDASVSTVLPRTTFEIPRNLWIMNNYFVARMASCHPSSNSRRKIADPVIDRVDLPCQRSGHMNSEFRQRKYGIPCERTVMLNIGNRKDLVECSHSSVFHGSAVDADVSLAEHLRLPLAQEPGSDRIEWSFPGFECRKPTVGCKRTMYLTECHVSFHVVQATAHVNGVEGIRLERQCLPDPGNAEELLVHFQ